MSFKKFYTESKLHDSLYKVIKTKFESGKISLSDKELNDYTNAKDAITSVFDATKEDIDKLKKAKKIVINVEKTRVRGGDVEFNGTIDIDGEKVKFDT